MSELPADGPDPSGAQTGAVPRSPRSLAALATRLRSAGFVGADEEAEELTLAAPDGATLEAFARRRERGEPLPWITGTTVFCGHTVRVDPGVYVPRLQTEELARRAGTRLNERGPGARAADLCAGSGAVAVHLLAAAPHAAVIAVDSDLPAAICARRNGVAAVVGDLGTPLARRSFDVVTAVAPYVPSSEIRFLPADVQRYEPRRALDGGPDGLDVVRRVVAAAAELLRPGGWLLTEIGGDQDRQLAATLHACGFGAAATWCDEDSDLRGLEAPLALTR